MAAVDHSYCEVQMQKKITVKSMWNRSWKNSATPNENGWTP